VGVLLILSGLRFIFLQLSRDREIKPVNYLLATLMGASISAFLQESPELVEESFFHR
jgi:hypothetical protein